jgi:Domain of unknown function (DUF4760)
MALSDLTDWPFWEHVGKVAPIITAAIAFGAARLALASLRTQKDIARKRAAIDVFLKTEMDKEMVKAYRAYEDGLEKSKQYKDIAQFYNAEIEVYRAVRTYLDVNELICIGINSEAFDQRVCYGFWHGILNKARTEGAAIIDHARNLPDGGETRYEHILNVNDRRRRSEAVNTDYKCFSLGTGAWKVGTRGAVSADSRIAIKQAMQRSLPPDECA